MSARAKNKVSAAEPLLPDEHKDIRVDIADIFAEPELWMDLPNTNLGGCTPRQLIGTDREWWLRQLLRMIKYGIPT